MPKPKQQLTFTTYSPLDSKRYHDAPTHEGKFYRIRKDNGKFEVRLCPAVDGNGSPVGSVFLKLCGKLSAAESFANRHYRKASEEQRQSVVNKYKSRISFEDARQACKD